MDVWGQFSGGWEVTKVFAIVHLLFAAAFMWIGRKSMSAKTTRSKFLLSLNLLVRSRPDAPVQFDTDVDQRESDNEYQKELDRLTNAVITVLLWRRTLQRRR